MCKESVHFVLKKVASLPSPQPSPLKGKGVLGGERELLKKEKGVVGSKGLIEEDLLHKHHHSDDKHHCHDDDEKIAHKHEENHLLDHHHEHENPQHHLHDDVVSLAHRHHNHQHLPLMQNQAQARAHSCHAGDGHDHGSTPSVGESRMSVGPLPGLNKSSASHDHSDGEHEHCPKCDEHLVDHDCPKCGYQEQH